MSTFSLIGDINSKTIRKNNPNNFTNLVFTEKYFDK
jgi:hypothetical protein